jgi:hypothetical protein
VAKHVAPALLLATVLVLLLTPSCGAPKPVAESVVLPQLTASPWPARDGTVVAYLASAHDETQADGLIKAIANHPGVVAWQFVPRLRVVDWRHVLYGGSDPEPEPMTPADDLPPSRAAALFVVGTDKAARDEILDWISRRPEVGWVGCWDDGRFETRNTKW